MPEYQLKIPVLYCHTSVLGRRQARDCLGGSLLDDLGGQIGVDSPCERSSELDDPGTHILLSQHRSRLSTC